MVEQMESMQAENHLEFCSHQNFSWQHRWKDSVGWDYEQQQCLGVKI